MIIPPVCGVYFVRRLLYYPIGPTQHSEARLACKSPRSVQVTALNVFRALRANLLTHPNAICVPVVPRIIGGEISTLDGTEKTYRNRWMWHLTTRQHPSPEFHPHQAAATKPHKHVSTALTFARLLGLRFQQSSNVLHILSVNSDPPSPRGLTRRSPFKTF